MIFRLLVLLVSTQLVASGSEPLQVAVFEGNGVGKSATQLIEAINAKPDGKFEVCRISSEQIRSDELARIDVLIHPGGSGSKQGNDLGEEGRQAVREFVSNGGGYLGVCGGAYLATNDYSWSLDLVDAKVVDRKHWARGTGTVTLQLAPAAAYLFSLNETEMSIHYGQGPLLARREWDDVGVPDYESLAIYDSEIAKNGAPRGIMKGTSAVIRCQYGAGRVFCFSPHPELTEGLDYLIPVAVDWLAKRQSVRTE